MTSAVLAVDVGGTKLSAALVTRDLQVRLAEEVPTPSADTGCDPGLVALAGLVERLRRLRHTCDWLARQFETAARASSRLTSGRPRVPQSTEPKGLAGRKGSPGQVLKQLFAAEDIHAELRDVPVTAPKSYFGDLGASTGAVELIASVLALQSGRVPRTLNYEVPDPECPVNVVRGESLATNKNVALVLNQNETGGAAAVVLAGE